MTGARESVVARLATLARIGAQSGGIARPLFGSAEFEARALFASWACASGFALVQDFAGNLFARREARPGGEPRPAILIGSHLDTVDGGGAYDGAYGVVAALGVLETLDALGAETTHAIEAVAWAGEEGSRFPLGCLGSGAYAGANDLAAIERLAADDGELFADAREGRFGLLPGVERRASFPRAAAYLELHIEQGPLLENAAESLGVVTAIAGARRFRVEIVGERGHAGTLPMPGRRDALCAASEIVLALEAAARRTGDCVATVGYLEIEPNETNVVPGRVEFRVDARSVDDARIDCLEHALREACADASRLRGTAAVVTELERRAAVPMDARLRDVLHATIASAGRRALDVAS
ncbi:MAG: hydantoinase/carbamoylase family amidase, partial [Candidatus Eremiobacteraeota bacterium]|nr:hydantoinase/carbamoylase family amidase [Candidatus Eremiobacteraeota bacterium]